jgi:hypothetical protein
MFKKIIQQIKRSISPKCEFARECEGYRENSFSCNNYCNRNYCGKYRTKMKENEERVYCEEYDAHYNKKEDKWIENKCKDKNCVFCKSRPDKPSEVNKK